LIVDPQALSWRRMKPKHGTSGARLRVILGPGVALGPGKADLLEAIAATGSISGGARKLGMSYRRAWLLVETMNRAFGQPLVQAKTGGNAGGGAAVSPRARAAVRAYRAMQRSAEQAVRRGLARTRELEDRRRHRRLRERPCE
jgi:molybdate transport system regulatory protein